jgi:hypothetical protein
MYLFFLCKFGRLRRYKRFMGFSDYPHRNYILLDPIAHICNLRSILSRNYRPPYCSQERSKCKKAREADLVICRQDKLLISCTNNFPGNLIPLSHKLLLVGLS